MADISRILGIEGKTTWESFKYLGVPIFKASPKTSPWIQIIDKIKSRINTWGAHWLNLAGKVVLIKVVLTSILIYQCSILLVPKRILANINSLLKNFLCKGGKQNENKLLLVSWEKITKPWINGGLQVSNLERQNLALGTKILWKVVTGNSSWCKNAL